MEKKEIEAQVEGFLKDYGYSFDTDSYVDIVAFVQKHEYAVMLIAFSVEVMNYAY